MSGGLPVCRLCGANRLQPVLSLGNTPLANSLLTAEQLDQPEPTFPLDLAFCEGCSLLQITQTIAPEQLFTEYLYFSSYSDTMLAHSRQLADRLMLERHLDAQSLVLEVASNDGYLLTNYASAGIPVLGIEPARNVARVAIERGVPTRCEFFGESFGRQLALEGHHADVIHAHNVLAHVPDPNGFMAGLAAVLKPDGLGVIEVPYVKDMLDRTEFDTIYHEHLFYFSVTALEALTSRNGLLLQHVERVPIHGGSLRAFITLADGVRASTREMQDLLAEEHEWGVGTLSPYEAFARSVKTLTHALTELLSRLKREGKMLAAYGAAAKGSTLLNFAGIGRNLLDFVVDRSPHKQGRFMPGVHVPIYSPDRLLDVRPDYVLLLTWNFADEILGQQAAYRQQGGHFIIPLPQLTVV